MIYEVCQIGVAIPLQDIAVHTYMDLNSFVAKMLKNNGKAELPKQSMSDFTKSSGKNYG